MPFTTIRVIDGVFSKEQKAQLIEKSPKRWSRSRARACGTWPGSSLKKSTRAIGRSGVRRSFPEPKHGSHSRGRLSDQGSHEKGTGPL